MFKICRGKGFQITFDNGWTVSVQFGPGNYCQGYPKSCLDIEKLTSVPEFHSCENAEIAAWNDSGWYNFSTGKPDTGDNIDVKGYQTPREVVLFMATVALLPKES